VTKGKPNPALYGLFALILAVPGIAALALWWHQKPSTPPIRRDSRDVPDTTYGPNRQERGELPETIIQEEEGGDADPGDLQPDPMTPTGPTGPYPTVRRPSEFALAMTEP
jgi:hypothetical protein